MRKMLGPRVPPSLPLCCVHPLGGIGAHLHCGQSGGASELHAKALQGAAAAQQQQGMEATEICLTQDLDLNWPIFLIK